jgi:hypothetical protein
MKHSVCANLLHSVYMEYHAMLLVMQIRSSFAETSVLFVLRAFVCKDRAVSKSTCGSFLPLCNLPVVVDLSKNPRFPTADITDIMKKPGFRREDERRLH